MASSQLLSSMSATVEIRKDDGTYTAVDTESGAAGSGKTKAMALVALAAALKGGTIGNSDATGDLRALSSAVQQRFDDANVTDEDVDEAIEWVRSQ